MAGTGRLARAGARAGGISVVVFTWFHELTISDIWSMFVPMVVAGAMSGATLAWSYGRLVAEHRVGSWITYNAVFVGVLYLLGLVSVAVFEPQTTMAAVVAANQPPDDMIRLALPLTMGFTVIAAAGVTLAYRGDWHDGAVVFLTSLILVGALGLNVSALGLIAVPAGSWGLVAEFYALILLLAAVFVGSFVVIERLGRRFVPAPGG